MPIWVNAPEIFADARSLRFADDLDINRTQACGHLVALWTACKRGLAPTGDISHLTAFTIANAADWHGDADVFVRALLDAAFIGPLTDAGLFLLAEDLLRLTEPPDDDPNG